ncbi:MAG TPA: hypothetical protein VEL76_04695, partial [Gemmataceae bacterium]|nr:hypothetical protein [Gemmataceae bacterium]
GATEALDLGWLCRQPYKGLYRASAGFYRDAFAADPRLGDELKSAHRYNAACSAALAAAGQGEDVARLGAMQRLALRRQALTWLRAELSLSARLVASGEVGRSQLARSLASWQKETALAGLRDKAELDKLSAEEQAACEKFWADVAALLKKSEEKAQ